MLTHESATELAEDIYDLIVDKVNDGIGELTVKEWTAVRRSLISRLTASIEADKALGHDVENTSV